MGSFANSLFTVLLGWLQSFVSAVWNAFTSENGNTLFTWIGRNWILIAGILCVIGLVVDLCVYLLRWKPFRVWKSFFSRRRETEGYESQPGTAGNRTPLNRPSVTSGAEEKTKENTRRSAGIQPETDPDLSRLKTDTEAVQSGRADYHPAEKPVTVTNAGYIVPEDSPYRRPSGGVYDRPAERPERPTQPAETSAEAAGPVLTRRRRRISISELFSDPEEDLRSFDAPQHIIDSKKAYHEPVYPRGWKKDGDDGHE